MLAAVVLPSEDELDKNRDLENWYVEQVYKLTVAKGQQQHLPVNFVDDVPDNVMQKNSAYLQESSTKDGTGLFIQVTSTPTSNPDSYQHRIATKYFQLHVLNNIGRILKARRKPRDDNMEGYGICLSNKDEDRQVQVVFEMMLTSEVVVDDSADTNKFDKDEHLTPLERSLDNSINSANAILREMSYMERREQRMRKTAESINSRVRWFSYLSVSVLLAVTYIQVSYLKRYFHKKKLM